MSEVVQVELHPKILRQIEEDVNNRLDHRGTVVAVVVILVKEEGDEGETR